MADLEEWAGAAPTVDGSPHEDAARLAAYVRRGSRFLRSLPPRPDRDPGQQRTADRVLERCRFARNRYLAVHAEAVYDRLTGDRTRHPRIDELVFAAAEEFPGLVPTRAEHEAERRVPQTHKDGHEIDQGIFFRALLRVPSVGDHLMDAMLRPTPAALDLLPDFRHTGRADLGSVLLERRGRAAHLTLRNRHCLNAEDDALVRAMEVAVDLVLLDDRVGVGVLRGDVMTHRRYHGKRVFSAGINLRELYEGRISFVDFLLGRELGFLSKVRRGLSRAAEIGAGTQKPWVGAVDAFAIGGGLQLLLVLDRVVAASDAYFSLPAAQEGIVPGVANLRLGGFTGSRLARRIILSGQRIHATDPESSLLCDEVVPPHELDAAVERAAAMLDNPAVVANRQMFALAEEPTDVLREYLAEFAYLQARRMYSADVLDRLGRTWSSRAGTGAAG